MKSFIAIILAFSLVCPAYAKTDAKPYVRLFADTYVRAQINEQLKKYLNNNPQVIGSSNNLAGTAAVKFISRILAVHNFIVAERDIDKAFAAAQFVGTDPTSALIIFAAQLTATYIELRLQKKLAGMREQTKRIDRETMTLLTQSALGELSQQQLWIHRISHHLDEIEKLEETIIQSPFYKVANGERLDLDPADVAQAIDLIFILKSEYKQFSHWMQFVSYIDVDANKLPNGSFEYWTAASEERSRRLKSLQTVDASFRRVFKAVEREKMLRDSSADINSEQDLYNKCIAEINKYKLEMSMPLGKSNVIEDEFILDCSAKFKIKVN